MISTSNLIIISPAMDAQRSRPNCTKSAGQHVYAQGSRPNCTESTKQHVYTPNQLRSIGKQYKNGNKLRILPFGAIRQIRDLCLNKRNKRKYRKNLHRHLFKQTRIYHKNLKEVNYDDRDGDDPTKYLRIVTVNTRSIKNKQKIVLEAIRRYSLDLLVVTETWLKTQTKIKYGYSH